MTQEYEYQYVMMLLGVEGPFKDPTEKVRFLKLSGKHASEIYTGTFLEGYAVVPSEKYDELRKYSWTVVINKWDCKKTKDGTKVRYKKLTFHKRIGRQATKEEKSSGSSVMIFLWRHIKGTIFSKKIIDHIDQNTGNNSLNNLRVCSVGLNSRNTSSNNGFTKMWGTSANKKSMMRPKPYKAQFSYNGITYPVGSYVTELEAHEAAVAKYIELTGREPDLSHMKKQDQEVKP